MDEVEKAVGRGAREREGGKAHGRPRRSGKRTPVRRGEERRDEAGPTLPGQEKETTGGEDEGKMKIRLMIWYVDGFTTAMRKLEVTK